MKDIDFDELDRAVNSLMAGGQAGEDQDKKDEPAVEIGGGRTAEEAPAMHREEVAPKPEPSAEPAKPRTRAESPVRKTGRFMDIVHRPTDRRTARTLTPPSTRPSRYQDVDFSPVAESLAESESAISSPEADESLSTSGAASSMPDPIDFANSLNSGEGAGDGASQSSADQSYSPFVPEVKVSKRPLGGSSTIDPSAGAAESLSAKRELKPDVHSQLPAEPAEQLPAELHDDLIAIESGAAMAADEDADRTRSPEAQIDSISSEMPASSSGTLRPGMESIPRQYSTAPTVSDSEADGDIFNTEAFRAPLSHPAKQKSGWLTVVLIVLLIILGVGIGVLVYLFVL